VGSRFKELAGYNLGNLAPEMIEKRQRDNGIFRQVEFDACRLEWIGIRETNPPLIGLLLEQAHNVDLTV
jgi:hypothetical protein